MTSKKNHSIYPHKCIQLYINIQENLPSNQVSPTQLEETHVPHVPVNYNIHPKFQIQSKPLVNDSSPKKQKNKGKIYSISWIKKKQENQK